MMQGHDHAPTRGETIAALRRDRNHAWGFCAELRADLGLLRGRVFGWGGAYIATVLALAAWYGADALVLGAIWGVIGGVVGRVLSQTISE